MLMRRTLPSLEFYEGWDFSKMAVMRGWEIFTKNGGGEGGGRNRELIL